MNFNKLNKIILEDDQWSSQIKNSSPNLNNNTAQHPGIKMPNNPAVNQNQNPNPNTSISGNINVQRLLKYFPSQDPVRLKTSITNAMRGRHMNNLQLITLGNAFIDLLKADPRETTQVMNLLKKVSLEDNKNEEV